MNDSANGMLDAATEGFEGGMAAVAQRMSMNGGHHSLAGKALRLDSFVVLYQVQERPAKFLDKLRRRQQMFANSTDKFPVEDEKRFMTMVEIFGKDIGAHILLFGLFDCVIPHRGRCSKEAEPGNGPSGNNNPTPTTASVTAHTGAR